MDFYSTLKRCYKKGIEPFVLYSKMSDTCKGDLKLKKEVVLFYEIYKECDIVERIYRCPQKEFDLLLNEYDVKYRNVLIAIARCVRSDLNVNYQNSNLVKKKVEVKRENPKTVVSRKNKSFTNQQTHLARQTAINACQMLVRQIHPKRNIKVSSLLTDLEVLTSATVVDYEIRIKKNGSWVYRKGGILKRTKCVYLNVENVVADKIEIYIPKDKYAKLEVNKTHGNLNVCDKENCFDELSINLSSGDLTCCSSAKFVRLKAWVGETHLEYYSLPDGNVDIRNTLGNIHTKLFFAKKVKCDAVSVYGKIANGHKGAAGNEIKLKIKSKYGNIDIA